MKTLTAADRKSLIRLASSLPKGDKSRRAILVGLSKVAAKKLTLMLDPGVHQEINEVYKKVHRALDYSDLPYAFYGEGLKMTDDLYEEVEQGQDGQGMGFGLIGSILPHLSSSSKREVEKALASQGVGVADSSTLKRHIEWDAENEGDNFFEYPFEYSVDWRIARGKAVDAAYLGF